MRKDQKRLQFYNGFGRLMKSEGLVVLLSGVYGKSRIKKDSHLGIEKGIESATGHNLRLV